jgi:glucosyl-3-phosphoglycerate phosphatase
LTGRLIVARHGRTAWNAAGRYQGQSDPPLDDIGRAEAAALAKALAADPVTAVVASDLQRARQTAEVVAEAAGTALLVTQALREVDLGGWEGLDRDGVAAAFPAELAAWEAGADVRRGGGGETTAEAGERAAEALLPWLALAQAGASVVVVAHGVVLQAALGRLGVARPPHLANGEYLRVPLPQPGPVGWSTVFSC